MLPWVAILIGSLGALFLMTRKHKTWGSEGVFLGLAITVGLGVLLGWYLDQRLSFTTLISWGLSTSDTTVQIGTYVFVAGLIAAIGGMLSSAWKSGQFVS